MLPHPSCPQHFYQAWFLSPKVGVGTEDVREMRGIPVSRYVVHERYDRRWVRNDIALLRTRYRIELGSGTAVTAACLPAPSDDPHSLTGRHAVVSGWGVTEFSKKLRIRDVMIPFFPELELEPG